MPESRSVAYWDACNFLSYVNEIEDRIPVLQALLADSASDNGRTKIYTSTLSKVEVSFGASEQNRRVLDPETEARIDSLWADPGAIVLVEFHDGIGAIARQLTRSAITQGWSLKPIDAIHLATAAWLHGVGIAVTEFHTYDTGLYKYAAMMGFNVVEPYTPQPRML